MIRRWRSAATAGPRAPTLSFCSGGTIGQPPWATMSEYWSDGVLGGADDVRRERRDVAVGSAARSSPPHRSRPTIPPAVLQDLLDRVAPAEAGGRGEDEREARATEWQSWQRSWFDVSNRRFRRQRRAGSTLDMDRKPPDPPLAAAALRAKSRPSAQHIPFCSLIWRFRVSRRTRGRRRALLLRAGNGIAAAKKKARPEPGLRRPSGRKRQSR